MLGKRVMERFEGERGSIWINEIEVRFAIVIWMVIEGGGCNR